MKAPKNQLMKQIRLTTIVFCTLLVLSGLTAFPIESELHLVTTFFERNNISGTLYAWFIYVQNGINEANHLYPFLSYGLDWLAFAHLVISIFFIGVYRDPVRNIWITKTGLIACVSVFPLAFVAGQVREIPLFWILIDCSFGLFGLIPLVIIYVKTKQLVAIRSNQ